MAKDLDEMVKAFRERAFDGGPCAYVWIHALTQKVREAGQIAIVAALVATGVNATGYRGNWAWTPWAARMARAGPHSYAGWWPGGFGACVS